MRDSLRLIAGLFSLTAAPWLAAAVDFDREVRPILSDKCFHCHGPDESGRKAKLRLDTSEGSRREKDGVRPVVPGRSAESEIIFRITSTDTEEVMPPPDSKLGRLTPAQIDVLRRWIDEGAEYRGHWAFEKLAPVTVPAIAIQDTETRRPGDAETGNAPALAVPASPRPATHPIDALVQSKLSSANLALAPEADRATLIRRVAFDLTGLPPTPAEIAAFVADASADAYPRLVDRLLASPRYGERMTADWLDLARYADSYGFQVDRPRDMWPWRDWVIKAFNENLSWDKFVTWQLAGDLLPNATDEQVLATAFNRLHAQEAEGGSVEEEYRVNYVNDRVTTFGTAFLGLTLECARCHDHKFDPIAQKEFYSLAAFFQNIDEAGLYSFFTQSAPTPAMWLTDAAHRERYAAAVAAVKDAEIHLAALRDERRATFAARFANATPTPVKLIGEIARFSFDQRETPPPPPQKQGKAPDAPPADDAAATEKLPGAGRYASAIKAEDFASTAKENESVPGRSGRAVKLTGDHAITTKLGNFHRHDPFSISLWMQTPDVKERAVVLHRSRAWTDAASRGYELLIEEGKLKWSLIHFWPGDAISVRALDRVPVGEWVHVTVINDGSSRAAGLRIVVNGQPVRTEVIRDRLTKDITGGGGDFIAVGERFRDRGFTGGLVDELRVFNHALTAPEAREVFAPGAAAADDREARFEFYLANQDESYHAQLAALTTARAAVTKLAEEAREIMVMRELPQPKPAYVLKRGEYDQRGERVSADTPAALPPFPTGQPRNRLGLARWLTDPRHPLMARVTVNRFWQATFGRGLVKTADDFGTQGERPEHPALLDWLAGEFVRSGWDVKALLKIIVTSRTYRQRSFASPENAADDPENVRLARGPSHRLPAEMIRDQALAASGLLVEKIGGPPVFLYDHPESFKPEPAGKGEALHRRSLYTFWRRNGPAPVLEAFDVPNRVVCVAKRDTTSTALHALVLLNGPQFVEAARVLAEELQRAHAGHDDTLVAQAFLRLTGRVPDATEQPILLQLLKEQREWFAQHPAQAAAYLKVGEKPAAATLPAPEIAAVATLVNTLMNHDLFSVKR